MWVCVASPATASGITCTWNPSDKSTAPDDVITLENGDLDCVPVIPVSTAHYCGVRATTSRATSKRYCEFLVVDYRSSSDQYIGLANGSFTLGSNPAGSGNIPLSWRCSGRMQTNGTNYATLTAVAKLDVACLAADVGTGKYWWNLNNGAWIGGGDPATDTTPIGTFTTAVTAYPWSGYDNIPPGTYRCTIHAHAANQAYSPPSGFTPWGD